MRVENLKSKRIRTATSIGAVLSMYAVMAFALGLFMWSGAGMIGVIVEALTH